MGTDTSPDRRPQFFIVGHPKCGTTAMALMLKDHPRVFMTDPKEPTFFCPDIQKPWINEDQYLRLFDGAGADQLAGEASVWYLASHVSAEAIAERYPASKIIIALREPVSFMRSLHLQMLEVDVETEEDFSVAIAEDEARRTGTDYVEGFPRTVQNEIRKLVYLDHVHYTDQLRRFHRAFPTENIHLVIYEDFRQDNASHVRQMYRFLGLDDHVPSVVSANPTVRVRMPRVHQYASQVRQGSAGSSAVIKSVVKRVTNRSMRDRLARTALRFTTGEPATISESLVVDLKRRLVPEVEELSAYLGRDLIDQWGYTEVLRERA
jgi:hypothetical protein